ncbi:hypothetical protein GCM10011531_26670 [Aquaticitalea lipolytica]|uniref:Uncharacterized protein n=1 Tax=Aquaticitalea lipolytica TaxID=1247562 RepID=A0A8J2TUL0_9FLAO|nr:hypothetical protein [Aquaticitalea lipolytica]GFZ93324.1 hypothetical protein GCM10011531_26670 [Aquaticitalea lipolytica]
MKKTFASIIIIALVLVSCKKEQNPFLISKNAIGFLTDTTQVKDLELVFPNDSIATYEGNETFNLPVNMVEIFDTNKNKLLILTPREISDSTSTIGNVRIVDSRYKTEKGISTLSTFKDIQKAYKISKIDNLINSVLISVNEINASFSIDKTELPANLRYDTSATIEAIQIPESAKIKFFFLYWD